MKTKLLIISVVMILSLSVAPALADYYGGRVYYSRISTHSTGNGGEFTLRSDGVPGLLLSNSAYALTTRAQDGNAESFQSFCLEVSESVAQPMDIQVSTTFIDETTGVITGLGSHAIKGGMTFGDNLDQRTAYLYHQFATGVLSSYDYTVAGRDVSAGDLQKAIWWIEGESLGSNAGQSGIWITEATNKIASGAWSGIGQVRALNTWVPGHVGDLDYKLQDQLFLVPVPAAVLLGVLGLGVASIKLRKYA